MSSLTLFVEPLVDLYILWLCFLHFKISLKWHLQLFVVFIVEQQSKISSGLEDVGSLALLPHTTTSLLVIVHCRRGRL